MLPIINHFPPRAFSDLETLFSACHVEQSEPAKRGITAVEEVVADPWAYVAGFNLSVRNRSMPGCPRHRLYVAPPELRDESRRAILQQLSVRPQKCREQFDGFVASDLR